MASTDNDIVETKPKRRNSEKRKEKSRNAARCRRTKETEIFYELAHELPMPHSLCAQLDKAGIMRLALSYLKISKLVPKVVNIKQEIPDEADDEDSNCSTAALTMDQVMDGCYQKALEGFTLVLSAEGDIIYISDCVSVYLGLKQTDIMGHSIYDYTHPCDHEEIREQLSSRHMVAPIKSSSHHKSTQKKRHHHDFLIRFKCTLTPRGKKVNLKSAVYKVIQCSGHVKTAPAETIMGYRFPPMPCLVMVGTPIHHPANIEIPLDGQTFLTRHSMDMKFTYCDDRIEELLGYESKELVGRSFYDFYHALDNASIEKCHRDLFAKGQTRTGSYRFLAKEGGYAWLQTEATVIYSNKTNKPQCVVCVNYCLSTIEEPGLILSKDQTTSDTDSGVAEDIGLSTEDVFAPKENLSADDDSSDELLFWLEKDEAGIEVDKLEEKKKELIEKLECLAPVAGDASILQDPVSLDDEILQAPIAADDPTLQASIAVDDMTLKVPGTMDDPTLKILCAEDELTVQAPGAVDDLTLKVPEAADDQILQALIAADGPTLTVPDAGGEQTLHILVVVGDQALLIPANVENPLVSVDGKDPSLLDFINKMQGEIQGEQLEDTEDELIQVEQMSLSDGAEPQMFVPFDPFAPLSDDNKLTTIEELADEVDKEPVTKDGYYSPPASSVAGKNILTSNNDPLMPDSRPLVTDKPPDIGYIPPEDLEMRAPFIPIDDFELGSDANEINTPFGNLSDPWMPVDPFGQNASRVENKSQNYSPCPFSPSSMAPSTPPTLATPAQSPGPVTSMAGALNASIGSPPVQNYGDGSGGGLQTSLNRSMPNLNQIQIDPSQLFVLLNTPQQQSPRMRRPDNIMMPVPPVQNPPWNSIPRTPISSPHRSPCAPPPAPNFVGTPPHSLGSPPQRSNFASRSPMKRAHGGESVPGLMSMLKRKATMGLQEEEPGRKLMKNSAGMSMMSSPRTVLQAPPTAMALLEPQHQVSGVGDDGSFSRFLHKFALSVSNENKGCTPGEKALFAQVAGQVNPLQQNIDVTKNPDSPPGRMERRDSLPLIDCQDAEVNAPLQSVGGLLQGEELLKALDASMNRVPSQTDFQSYQVN